MTMATTNGISSRATTQPRARAAPSTTVIHSLTELVGAYPDAVRALFAAGRSTAPGELSGMLRGRLLCLEPTRDVHFLLRPIVVAVGARALVWQGKSFDADGTGANVVLGRSVARFVFDTEPSALDGEAALVLRYDYPLHDNPWPLRNVRDELRTIGDGIAIGPACFFPGASGRPHVVAWFGLERDG